MTSMVCSVVRPGMGCAAVGPAVRSVAARARPKDRSAVEGVVMSEVSRG